MMGPSHRLFGALFGATYASMIAADTPTLVASTIISTTMAYGASSPDMDQTKTWKKFSTHSGLSGLLAHRHLTHWWGLAVLAVFPILGLAPETRWVFWALWLGWVSHLVGDFIFGKIPLLPWGRPYFGIGLKTDGWIEKGALGISPLRIMIVVALLSVLWFRPTWDQVLALIPFI